MHHNIRLFNSNHRKHQVSTGYFILLMVALPAIIFAGCGSERITVDTRVDNIDSGDLLQVPGLYISYVRDDRGGDPFTLGHITGQVSGKKVDLFLADSLSALMRNYFNDLLLTQTRTVPVNVVINSFSLVENISKKNEYHLFGSLSYNYIDEIGKKEVFDSRISRDISRDQSTLAENINAALRGSLTEFCDNLNIVACPDEDSSIAAPFFNSADIPELPVAPGYADTVDVDSSSAEYLAPDSASVRTNFVFDEPVAAPDIQPSAKHLGAGIAYYTGDKITGGMQIEFRMSWQRPDWEYGFSVGFFYVDFIDPPYEGNLWAFNLPWNMKYMLSSAYISPYIGGTVKLIAGQNNESGTNSPGYYSGYDNRSTFWGPTFEESFGLALDRSVFIEAGVYEMFLFNTKLLSNDTGFRVSLHFTVTK